MMLCRIYDVDDGENATVGYLVMPVPMLTEEQQIEIRRGLLDHDLSVEFIPVDDVCVDVDDVNAWIMREFPWKGMFQKDGVDVRRLQAANKAGK